MPQEKDVDSIVAEWEDLLSRNAPNAVRDGRQQKTWERLLQPESELRIDVGTELQPALRQLSKDSDELPCRSSFHRTPGAVPAESKRPLKEVFVSGTLARMWITAMDGELRATIQWQITAVAGDPSTDA